MRIREATAEDLPELLAMGREFTAFFTALDPLTRPFEEENFAQTLRRLCFQPGAPVRVMIAERNGAAIGFAVFGFGLWLDTSEGVLQLNALFIRSTARGSGLGEAFMARLKQIARETGCAKVMWNVWVENAAAFRFYDRLGAERVGDEVIMMVDAGC